jgi:tetrahydromethanopterin S-methyltransferase subunit G
MSDTDRILGRLEEFKDATEKRLDRIENKLDSVCRQKAKKRVSLTVGVGALLASVAFAIKEVFSR